MNQIQFHTAYQDPVDIQLTYSNFKFPDKVSLDWTAIHKQKITITLM